MHQSNQKHRTSGLLPLFACAIALALGATPALAEEEALAQGSALSATVLSEQSGEDVQAVATDETSGAAGEETSVSAASQESSEGVTTVDEPGDTDDQQSDTTVSSTTEENQEAAAATEAQEESTVPEDGSPTVDTTSEQADSDQVPEVSTQSDTVEPDTDTDTNTDLGSDTVPDPEGATEVDATKTYVIGTDLANSGVLSVVGSIVDGAQVISGAYTGAAGQTWQLIPYQDTSWYRIATSSSPDLTLEADGQATARIVATNTAADLRRLLWAFVGSGSTYRLTSAAFADWAFSSVEASSGSSDLESSTEEAAGQEVTLIDAHPSVAAGTAKVQGGYNLTLSGSSKVLEVRGASTDNGAQVWLWSSNGKQHQKVYLERDADGYYIIWIVGTGKVVDVKGSSILPGAKIIQWNYHGKDNQKWAIYKNDDGSYRFVNKATGLVLGKATASSDLVGLIDDGSATNTFVFNAVDFLSAGIYSIQPRTTNATALDVCKASSTSGANLILYKNTNALNQRFEVVSTGTANVICIRTASSGGWLVFKNNKVMQDGYGEHRPIGVMWRVTFAGGAYGLINVRSGKALDMRGGSTKSGTSIICYTPNAKDSQHFNFVKSDLISANTYYLTSAYGTRLEVRGGSTAAGANVQTWSPKGTSNNLHQRFLLKRVGSGYYLINARSGLVVGTSEIYGDSTGKSTHNATQRFATGKNNQIWKAQIDDGGYVKFVNVASTMALEVASSASGANVRQGAVTANSDTQKWKLTTAPSSGATSMRSATTKILFIGNSFTFYQDLPNLVLQRLPSCEAVCCTRGSATLSHHLSSSDGLGRQTQRALSKGGWDYVVIQDMSTQSIDNYSLYLQNLKEMVDIVRASGATPIIYGTWAFVGGYGTQGYGADKRGITTAEMHAQLQAAFARASKATNVTIANVGQEVARNTSQHTPFDARLYCDNKHLSAFGANLAALVFSQLFKSLI